MAADNWKRHAEAAIVDLVRAVLTLTFPNPMENLQAGLSNLQKAIKALEHEHEAGKEQA